jgi:subtilisin family serine protease
VSGASLQLAAPWHLDRLDQRSLPLDSLFAEPSAAGQGVDIYVLDSGVRASHADFGGRVQLARSANFFTEDDSGPDDVADVHGHGTFVASLAAGASYGVAKHANIIVLRIYGANATGE